MKYTPSPLSVITKSALVAVVTLGLAAASARAVTLVEDNFENRTAGALLAGTLPDEVGANPWSNFGDGQAARTNAGSASLIPASGAGGVPTAGGYVALPVYTGILSISADITMGVGANGSVGINVASGGSPYGALLLNLNTDGSISMHSQAANIYLGASSLIVGFDLANTYRLELRYDYSTLTASGYVNGVQMLSPRDIMFDAGVAGGAGFFAQGTEYPNGGTLDNFLVTANPVPEPSVVALLVAGMAGWLVVTRVRRKSVA